MNQMVTQTTTTILPFINPLELLVSDRAAVVTSSSFQIADTFRDHILTDAPLLSHHSECSPSKDELHCAPSVFV